MADENTQDSPGVVEVDAVSPKLGDLRVSSSAANPRKRRAKSEEVSDSSSSSQKGRKSGLVNMVPDSEQDARLGTKTQVFEDDEHTGSQG